MGFPFMCLIVPGTQQVFNRDIKQMDLPDFSELILTKENFYFQKTLKISVCMLQVVKQQFRKNTWFPCYYKEVKGFPGGSRGTDPACQGRRHKRYGFDPWVRKIPSRRAWPSTPVFLPGKPHGQRNWWATVHSVTELGRTEETLYTQARKLNNMNKPSE